jgi:hypothetical protein
MPPPVKASEFAGDLSDFLSQYKYQPKLTKKLDDLAGVNLTPELLNEIVLWKVNRYVAGRGTTAAHRCTAEAEAARTQTSGFGP